MRKIINQILKHNELLLGTKPAISKINIGFTNTLYDVNNSFIIKICTDASNEENFKKEIEFYNLNKDNSLIPKLYHSSIDKNDIPYMYEIIEKIEGVSLYNIWHKLKQSEREKIIKELCETMKKIHNNKGKPYNWSQTISDLFIKLYEKIRLLNIFSTEELALFNKAYSKFSELLKSDEFVLVHNDLHFDNILYNDGKIKLIDFERSIYAPKDFELDIIYKMVRKPWKFASEETEKYINLEDYSNIMKYIEKYYPEIAKTPNLYKRLAIYDMIYFMKQLLEYPHLDELKKDVLDAVKKLI